MEIYYFNKVITFWKPQDIQRDKNIDYFTGGLLVVDQVKQIPLVRSIAGRLPTHGITEEKLI